MTDFQRLHAIVQGRVQGVSFRYYTERRAMQLGLVGWVRNLADGTVEATAEGPRAQLDNLLDFLQKGPPAARVTHVSYEWGEARGDFNDFRITG